MALSDEEIQNRFREKARDGKITCPECLALAKELGIPSHGIANMLTGMNIKIQGCQIGCFP